MFACEKMFLSSTSRKIFRDLRRSISKTHSASNIETISSIQESTDAEFNADRHMKSKWIKISRQNNIRALSTIQKKVKPPFFPEEKRREFMAVFPDIVRDITDDARRHADIPEVTERLAKVLEYNVLDDKNFGGLPTVISYKTFEKPENLTPENIKLANILAWCVEMLVSWFTMLDDVMDNAALRYGRPCWYKQEGVGIAVCDAVLIELSIFTLLRKYFGQRNCYKYMAELFQEILNQAILGQAIDMMCKHPDGTPRLDHFTMNRYKTLVKYKVACFFRLPVGLAMYFANWYDPEQHRQAERILLEMGEFFQIQNDFLDCFGDQEVTGKESSDIKEGKCTWLAVIALEKATPAQRKVMEEHYGKADENSIQMVKNLYLELDLLATYATFEEESFIRIRTLIQQMSKELPHELFFKLLDITYNSSIQD